MKLRKECEHGLYDAHLFHRWGTHPTQCPGGEFLPEGALVIEPVERMGEAEWVSTSEYIKGLVAPLLSSQVGESE